MKRYFFIVMSLIFILVSGCTAPLPETREHVKKTTAPIAGHPLATPSFISVKSFCKEALGNRLLLGETTLKQAQQWLETSGKDIQVNEKFQTITWSEESGEYNLFFHKGLLFSLWSERFEKYRPTLGEIISELGEPEYLYVGLAKNATSVGACEDVCYVGVTLIYPSKGIEFNSIVSVALTQKFIEITKDLIMDDIECFEPGRYEQFVRYRYGTEVEPPQLKWRGFGMKVILRE